MEHVPSYELEHGSLSCLVCACAFQFPNFPKKLFYQISSQAFACLIFASKLTFCRWQWIIHLVYDVSKDCLLHSCISVLRELRVRWNKGQHFCQFFREPQIGQKRQPQFFKNNGCFGLSITSGQIPILRTQAVVFKTGAGPGKWVGHGKVKMSQRFPITMYFYIALCVCVIQHSFGCHKLCIFTAFW